MQQQRGGVLQVKIVFGRANNIKVEALKIIKEFQTIFKSKYVEPNPKVDVLVICNW